MQRAVETICETTSKEDKAQQQTEAEVRRSEAKESPRIKEADLRLRDEKRNLKTEERRLKARNAA